MTGRFLMIVGFLAWVIPSEAVTLSRRATMTGNRGDNSKCTIEVDVDGTAEVEISGDMGRLVTLSGQTSEWRRFECSDRLPSNPTDFRFRGIDGRGRVNLVRDPTQNRGVAVVHIEDSQGGREGYTFDLEWRGGSDYGPSGQSYPRRNDRFGDRDRDYRRNDRYDRSDNRVGQRRGFGRTEAIQSCEDAVASRIESDGFSRVQFQSSNTDDRAGRRDWIVGSATARRGSGISRFSFSCSVNFDTGRVNNVEVNRR